MEAEGQAAVPEKAVAVAAEEGAVVAVEAALGSVAALRLRIPVVLGRPRRQTLRR